MRGSGTADRGPPLQLAERYASGLFTVHYSLSPVPVHFFRSGIHQRALSVGFTIR